MAETNKEVFYQVVSGDKILPVYDVDAHRRIAAATASVDELSGQFTAHLNDYAAYKISAHNEFVDTSSWATRTFQPVGDYVSASEFESYQQQVADALDTKVDKSTYNEFVTEARAWDNEFYSAGADISISGHVISVNSDFVRLPYLQENYYDAQTVDEKIANFGGFQKANPTGTDNHPDVSEPRTNIIYLVKVGTTQKDPYYEWIYSKPEGEQGEWECIGEMSVPLADYYTKQQADERFQPSGDYVSASDLENYYTKQEADIEHNTLKAEIEDEVDEAISGLFNTTIKAGTKITITTASGADPDDIEYTINADAPDLPTFTAENGLSADYDEITNKWTFGVKDYENAGFAKYSTSANTFATSAILHGYTEDLNLNNNKIKLVNDKIIIQPGLYHIDMQLTLATTGAENAYYETTIKSLATDCADLKIIDASFAHSETVDLSYDVKIANDDTPLETTIEGFQVGGSCTINNLNIHEILQMPSKVNGGGGNYLAGAGINIINDTVSVKVGDGLWVPASSNNLEVKLGKGLTFSSNGGINALTIDNQVEAVVKTVEKLADDLDTKLTVNMPFADITTRHNGNTYCAGYIHGSAACLAQLFSVPINNKLYVSADGAKKVSCISVISNQTFAGKVIFGLFEYVYDAGGGNGDTNWVGDTGPVNWNTDGRHEFPLIHMAEGAELKAENSYYAVICAPTGDLGNMWLAGTTTGYSETFNAHPRLTFGFGNAKYKDGTGIDFTTTAGTLQNIDKSYSEDGHANPRFFMQIRNKNVQQV